MKIIGYICIVLLMTAHLIVDSLESRLHNGNDYFDFYPEVEEAISLNTNEGPKKFFFTGLPHSAIMRLTDDSQPARTTECITLETTSEMTHSPSTPSIQPPEIEDTTTIITEQEPSPSPATPQQSNEEQEAKAKELRNLVQHLYIAQARVQLEAAEIKKAQAVANTAQQALEESANHVRAITAALQNSQQEVASAAIRAQTAQLQLAAHDQLLFAARQDVDALSSQMVGLQAAEGISQPKITVDVSGLLEKLKQPLQEAEKPTAVPSVIQMPTPANKVYQQKQQKRILQQQFKRKRQQLILPSLQKPYYEKLR